METLFFLRETLIADGLLDEIIGFQLAQWRLNIDGCFFPVSGRVAVAQADSIVHGVVLGRDYTHEISPLEFFRRLGFVIVESDREESYLKQSCNFACLGAGTFVAYAMTDRINNILRAEGLEIIGIEGDELVKGNGGPHCMTRPVY
jgi:N-dimethylarginine dimethylaminohydrolase